MPRPKPLTLISIPQIERRQPLPQKDHYAGLLGFSKLPDDVAGELAHNIALMRATTRAVVGLTRQREAEELKRCAKKLRREQRTGRSNTHLRRLLADPRLGFSTETFLRLEPLTAAPTSELLAAVEACRRDIERLPRINPQRQARESAGATALWLFLVYAADSIRDEQGAWWLFVLAVLDDAGFPTLELKLYGHPESLRPIARGVRAGVEAPGRRSAPWRSKGRNKGFADKAPTEDGPDDLLRDQCRLYGHSPRSAAISSVPPAAWARRHLLKASRPRLPGPAPRVVNLGVKKAGRGYISEVIFHRSISRVTLNGLYPRYIVGHGACDLAHPVALRAQTQYREFALGWCE